MLLVMHVQRPRFDQHIYTPGKRKYCGVKYIVYGKKRCGGKSYKKGCRKVGKYCADGKYCRKYKGGYTCVFKKKRE